MLFQLRLDFVEGLFTTGAQVFAGCSGVECSGRKSEIQGECVFLFAGQFCKYGVELHEIRLIAQPNRKQKLDSFRHLFSRPSGPWAISYGRLNVRVRRRKES